MEFKKIILENCVNDIIDYRGKTPKKLKGEWNEKGTFRAVSAKNIKNMQLVNLESLKKVDNELYKKWMKKEVSKNDILLTSEAPLGESLFWDSDEKIVLSQRVFGLKPNTDIVNPKYLFAYLQTPKFKHELTSRESGTTVTGIRRKELEKTIIEVPSQNIQKFIGDLFYITNKKIKNNQNIIANLEELSQTLFKRWFVDFEFPDENGNPYKSSGGEMDESELGEIPKGWIVNNINDFANNNVITGKTPSTKVKENYSETGIPFLTIPDMHKDVFALNTERYISETGIEKLEKKILEKNSLAISCIATPGLVSIISNDTLTNQQINSFTPNKTELYYLYFYLKGMRNYIRDLGSGGSATLNLNKTQFEKIKLVKPINELLLKYDKLVHSNFEIILNFQKENNYLIQLRDTLLPKLMSGEIEIPDDIEVNKDELSI
ncbi:restriction endonuclease subunit S [Staphylococcus saprophyticus]|uniref:restriction endonuclease subunit S n=1 Tax=Staphylococcus saprophyticus TaxID=29385 RepID=UPI00374F0A8E